MPILNTNYPLHMVPGEKAYNDIFTDAIDNAGTPSFDPLFNVSMTENGRLDFSEVAMADMSRIPQRAGPNADLQEMTLDEMWKKTYTVTEYAAEFSSPVLHWSAMSGQLKASYPQQMAASARETIEYTAWGVFRSAASDVGPDGVSLVNDAHPLSNGGTADNKATTALAASSLNAAVAAMMRSTTPQGKVSTGYMPRFILVPPDLYGTATELTQARMIGDYSTLVTDANPIQQYGLQVIQSPWLTDATDWFLVVDPGKIPNGLRVVFAMTPTMRSGLNEQQLKYWGNVDFAFATGYSSWRAVYGSIVAG